MFRNFILNYLVYKIKKIFLINLIIVIVLLCASCFPEYPDIELRTINPVIDTYHSLDKIDRAVNETVTSENIDIVQSSEEIVDDIISNAVESINSITSDSNVESINGIISDSNVVNISGYTKTALEEPAPYKNPNILKQELLSLVSGKNWTYGKSPITWRYIRPNTTIISNYRPNGSAKYSININATSGEYGCFLPIFSETAMCDEYYEGRFYCFDDYTKLTPVEFRFTNSLSDLKLERFNIIDILKIKYPEIIEVKKGVFLNGDKYINIVYVDELYDILNNR